MESVVLVVAVVIVAGGAVLRAVGLLASRLRGRRAARSAWYDVLGALEVAALPAVVMSAWTVSTAPAAIAADVAAPLTGVGLAVVGVTMLATTARQRRRPSLSGATLLWLGIAVACASETALFVAAVQAAAGYLRYALTQDAMLRAGVGLAFDVRAGVAPTRRWRSGVPVRALHPRPASR